MKGVGVAVTAIALAISAPALAAGQTIPLATMTCKQFVDSPKDTIGVILTWMMGYLQDEDEPAELNFSKMEDLGKKLGTYCGQNPTHGVMRALDKVSDADDDSDALKSVVGVWTFGEKQVWIVVRPDGAATQCRIAPDGSVYFSKGAFRAPNILAWEKIWGDDQVVREKDAIKLTENSGLSPTSGTTAIVLRRAVRQLEGRPHVSFDHLPRSGTANGHLMKAASIYLGLVAAMSASACLAELQDENILTKLPDGFKIDFQQRNKDMLISEMVPVKQSVKNWTEMVTVQVFYGLKATPDQFKARIESGLAAACPKSESRPVAQGEENGYPSMVWLQNCPLNKATGKPEITWFKAIQGNDSFYIVQVAFKAWPSKEQITQWMRYLKDATVCDTRLPDRACVAPGAGGPR